MNTEDEEYRDDIAIRVMDVLLKDEELRTTSEGILNYEGIASTSYIMASAMLHAKRIAMQQKGY